MASWPTHSDIVVGVDGSPSCEVALRWAAREATLRNVALTLVHIASMTAAGAPTLGWPASPVAAGLRHSQEEHARTVLADAVKVVEDSLEDRRPEINCELIFSAPVPTLVDLSKQVALVVVGCRGQGALQRGLLGSVSTGLIHHAHCPVAVIHDNETSSSPHGARMPVLVGIDGSPASELATAIAFDEACRRGVDVVALHAWSDADYFAPQSMEWSALRSRAEAVLAERLAGLQERYPDVGVSRALVLDHPARHLLEQSESAQLVVVGSHGRGGFTGMLLGSVSTAVAHAARTPVIVARQR